MYPFYIVVDLTDTSILTTMFVESKMDIVMIKIMVLFHTWSLSHSRSHNFVLRMHLSHSKEM